MEGKSHQEMEEPIVREEGTWVDLENRREHDISLEIMETMHSLKVKIEIINAHNEKLLKSRAE